MITSPTKRPLFEICILAGGASSRMGKDKARLKIGRRTMLGMIRGEADKLGVRVRVIRRDLVERCGPLGGVLTGLKTARADAVLFLACDMPLVSAELLETILAQLDHRSGSVFVQSMGIGFPLVLRTALVPVVEQQIADGEFSIHRLCQKIDGRIIAPEPEQAAQLFNVNSPGDYETVKRMVSARPAKS